jgi:hypothetical protein
VNAFRDISGFGRLTLSAFQILIAVPAGNGYHLPSTRPGNNPETFPYYAKWVPTWTRAGSGTGSTAGWEQVPQDRYGSFTGTTDANGDVTITILEMPDTSYIVTATPESTTRYAISVHAKTVTTFKVNAAASAGTSVTINYQVKDILP